MWLSRLPCELCKMAFLTGDHTSGSDLSYMPSAAQSAESHAVYGPQMPSTDVYQTGGYWLTGTQMMNCVFSPTDHVADVAFDPLEELVWCISRLLTILCLALMFPGLLSRGV
ncbi:hypothetical protein AHF37_01555 [Paragonimus kellicotti]|nr:hypothetical protein AHF37_01555 [Paragonimus kellicotti]